MTSFQRTTKQLFIALIFFAIIGGIGYGSFRIAVPQVTPTPNPTSGLSPISVVSTKLFNVQNNDYDFLAKVANPNVGYGSPDVEYELTFFDASNSEISKKTGSFYILPGQTKYIVDLPVKLDGSASRADMTIKSVEWQKLGQLALGGINLLTKNADYSEINAENIFSKAIGNIYNSSDFDLNKVDVAIILFDETNTPIAVNKTEINTFLGKTTRSFEVFWPASFVGKVVRVGAEAGTNVFDNSNFIQQYGGEEKFKEFYNSGN
jgi:hypothetical protein